MKGDTWREDFINELCKGTIGGPRARANVPWAEAKVEGEREREEEWRSERGTKRTKEWVNLYVHATVAADSTADATGCWYFVKSIYTILSSYSWS